jgi:MYXO-CTERM domain-containing protein
MGPANSWDSFQVSWGEVYHDGQRFFMWYPGKRSPTTGFSLGLATSPDGKVWTRSPNNPVMTPPVPALGKGDDLGVESSPSVIRLGNTMRVYYGGFRSCCPEDTTVCLSTTAATGVANRAPLVDAGADQALRLGTDAKLDGTVMDDDTPVPLASVAATWTKTSGPGSVTFASATNLDTTASFSAPGRYTLALTASDTALMATDTVTIDVSQGGPDGGGPSVDAAAGTGGAGGRADAGRVTDTGSGGAAGQPDSGERPDAPPGSAGTGGGGGTQAEDGGASSTPKDAAGSGCGCSTIPRTPGATMLALAVVFLLVVVRRISAPLTSRSRRPRR